jgi:hypothetical protein
MNIRPNKVYFIRAGEDGPVKIGTAYSIEKRIRALQNAHYEPLTLVRQLEGDRHLEMRIHARFKHLRIRLEWFQFDPAMLSEDFSALHVPLIDQLIQRYGSQIAMSIATGFTQATISGWRQGNKPSVKSAHRLIQLSEQSATQ